MSIKQRKKDHVDLTVSGEMAYNKPAGFENLDFKHNALPEIDLDEVTTGTQLQGRDFDFPLFISSMTGGYTDGGAVNAIIAEFCQDYNLPFGVGSQRVMLEHPEEIESFSIVRKRAPDAFIASNIGGAQLVDGLPVTSVMQLIDSIEADAVIVHLNPLQELVQPEGDRRFKGIEKGIGDLIRKSPVPVIVKETGAGISGNVALKLLDIGVDVIDIAGAGGTSWSKVESQRTAGDQPEKKFNEWGIPTLQCLREIVPLRQQYEFEIIASGGIRSSFDIAKSLCLGADFTAAAQPVIQAVVENGREGLEKLYEDWHQQLVLTLALLGCRSPNQLSSEHLYYH